MVKYHLINFTNIKEIAKLAINLQECSRLSEYDIMTIVHLRSLTFVLKVLIILKHTNCRQASLSDPYMTRL